MTRTNYIFIDFENVNETEIERIEGKPVHLTLVLGDQHKTLPLSLVKKLLKYSSQVALVENSTPGKNALDMVLSSQVGARREKDPSGYFHIVAKDRGYTALINHLKNDGVLAARHEALCKVPLLMNQSERLACLRERYDSEKQSRPGSRKALEAQIQHCFAHSVSDEEMEWFVQRLEDSKVFQFTGANKVMQPAKGPTSAEAA